MIISASRRSDIPTLFGEWFLNRLIAQEILVRNPINSNQVTKINLSPESIDTIVFWTKDPTNFLPYLDRIKIWVISFIFNLHLQHMII